MFSGTVGKASCSLAYDSPCIHRQLCMTVHWFNCLEITQGPGGGTFPLRLLHANHRHRIPKQQFTSLCTLQPAGMNKAGLGGKGSVHRCREVGILREIPACHTMETPSQCAVRARSIGAAAVIIKCTTASAKANSESMVAKSLVPIHHP